jgi:DNA-binding transcriptional ArsR family regulator
MPPGSTTTDVFSALGEERRRAILEVLLAGEAPVNELVARLALPQPTVSKHLRVLRSVGLVRCRTAGRQRLYRVHGPALEPLHEWVSRFEQLWNERLDRLDTYLTELQQEEPT